jgi:hypothetical protein
MTAIKRIKVWLWTAGAQVDCLSPRPDARVAHFSAFHFHRLFFSWTGETLGVYLPILTVAIPVGLGSTEVRGYTVPRTVDQISAVWDAMLREWLPGSGKQLDARPFLEHYPKDASLNAKTGVFNLRHRDTSRTALGW